MKISLVSFVITRTNRRASWMPAPFALKEVFSLKMGSWGGNDGPPVGQNCHLRRQANYDKSIRGNGHKN